MNANDHVADGPATAVPPVICVLGPTRVCGPGGPVAVGGALPRAFLAVLAIEAGRPVAIDRLTDLLWGAPPAGVKVALQQLASRLRPSLAASGLHGALRAERPGYRLDVDPDLVDLLRFRSLMRSSVEADRASDPAATIALASDALDLWNGRALADLVDLPLASFLAPLIDEERWRAEELRASALIADGRPMEAARLLADATAVEPLRERLWVLQATALLQAGRQGDAVRCARTGTALIASELGVPPGPELLRIGEWTLGADDRPPAPARPTDPTGAAAQRSLLDSALRRALANAERAAQAAMSRRAHGEAVHQWRRALDLVAHGDAGDEHRLRLLLGLGHAYNEGGQEAQARATCLDAAQIARRRSDPIGLAWAALGFCADHIAFSPPPEQAALLQEALDGLPNDEHLLRGRLLARQATELYWVESAARTRELAQQALDESELAGDAEGRLLARYAMMYGFWTPDHIHELVIACEAYLDDARIVGSRFHELLARRWLVPAVTELGDVARGGDEAQAAMDLADDLGVSVQQWITRVVAAGHALIAGDLARAEQLGNDGLALGAVAEPEIAVDYVSLLLWTLRWMQGRLDEIASLVEEVAAGPGLDLPRQLGLALTHAELGKVVEANKILDPLSAADLDGLHFDASWYIALAATAEAAARVGHVAAAGLVLDRLVPYRDRIAITTTTATGPIAHHVGLCAWTVGDHTTGIRELRESIAIADRCGVPAFGARSRIALAEFLATPGRSETDASDAAELARAAREVAVSVGMPGVVARADLVLQHH